MALSTSKCTTATLSNVAHNRGRTQSPVGLGMHFRLPPSSSSHRLSLASRSQRSVVVQAAQQDSAFEVPPSVLEALEGLGCDTSEGVTGFTPFTELFVGRTAMMGFAIGLATEIASGKGILQQTGLNDGTPNPLLFGFLVLAMGGGTAYSLKNTFEHVQAGTMTPEQYKRYASFFSILSVFGFDPKDAVAKYEGTYRAANEPETASSEEQSEEASTSPDSEVQQYSPSFSDGLTSIDELAYAQGVELNNARWGMVGFALAILIEAKTGGGMLPQFFGYLQQTGILGPGMYEVLIAEFTKYNPGSF
mmetsp:Transcript_6595/g.7584  ORF Transcript_6595/g.7584 Transcript_6595/m.7584 type:complete len:305 (-) Transcript_6595:662-1576(-)|eukprot:CAMPEP_0197852030 /NCGR_PEP_ID=MMETSP1438-20131217/19507_1 /TAXON_ID=1461541 /ORGANISM="Pterosperma sp., Strain CCMP1384" /LENGTH=304 /DNA_ID=CAMNT_0043465869 /DNA_START=128 /DNA_END=1042 /DNA_ORIENTATION=+